MLLHKDDLKFFKAFKQVIENGKFEAKGDAVITIASLFRWYESLGTRMVDHFKEAETPKKVEEPIKKIGDE